MTTDDTNDIAVFKVKPKFKYSDVTGAVKLPEIGIPFDQEWGRITGWGYFIVSWKNLIYNWNDQTWIIMN